jgi:hypothetical protein
LLLAGAILLSGCNDKSQQAAPTQVPSEVQDEASNAPAPGLVRQEAQTFTEFISPSLDLGFEYPGGWSVEESTNSALITSPASENITIAIADISYEVSLFLAGHGDMETSIEALVHKYTDSVAGATLSNYEYSFNEANGNIQAKNSFTYSLDGSNYRGLVDVEQGGSRVFLSLVLSPDDNRWEDALAAYHHLNATFYAGGTEGTLQSANLTELGFPEAPSGFYRYYNPVTGQFFFYPIDWTITSPPYDASVMLSNEYGAIMITQNWTDTFFAYYNNGYDLEECFDIYLDEVASGIQAMFGETPRYHDYRRMEVKNQELIKATFNYTVSAGTGRAFAELGSREMNGEEYVQATIAMYRADDSYSIDMFSIIMDSTLIYFPNL